MQHETNVFDPIHDELDQRVFQGETPKHSVVKFVSDLVDRAFFKEFGVHNEGYLHLYLTGSLTTYQYGPSSDCDTSAFPSYKRLEELTGQDAGTIRKRLIKMNIEHLDGTFLPGGSHPIQVFATPEGAMPQDFFSKGLRSAWDYQTKEWLVPPEKDRVHSIQNEFPEVYARAARIADKMTEMLDAHNYKAADMLWTQVHKKRQLDQHNGGGDFSEGNIVYKFLVHEGIVQRLRDEMHLQIETKVAAQWDEAWYADLVKQYGPQALAILHRFDSIWPDSVGNQLDYESDPNKEGQIDHVVTNGNEWKFAISNGVAKAWGDGEIMSLNDGFHPHSYVIYDDLNTETTGPTMGLGWITKPPLEEGDLPYHVLVRGCEAYTDDQILQMLTLKPGEAEVERSEDKPLLDVEGKVAVDWNNDELDPRILDNRDSGMEAWITLEHQVTRLARQYDAQINWLPRYQLEQANHQIQYDATQGWEPGEIKHWSIASFPHITGERSYMVALHEIGHAAFNRIYDQPLAENSEEEELWAWHFMLENAQIPLSEGNLEWLQMLYHTYDGPNTPVESPVYPGWLNTYDHKQMNQERAEGLTPPTNPHYPLYSTIKPITMKVIYDPQLDHIILGTQADAQHGKTIVGEYKDDEVTLNRNPYQFMNANYFRRLWTFSYPHRPLNKVHLQEEGIEGKKIELPTKPPRHRHMADASR